MEEQGQLLYDYILSKGTIVPIPSYDEELLRKGDVSRVVAESIRRGSSDWERLVPGPVRDQVTPFLPPPTEKSPHLFPWRLSFHQLPSLRCCWERKERVSS